MTSEPAAVAQRGSAARPGPIAQPGASAGPAAPWWVDAVVYQVYPRSFCDGNGDGTGDLPGIIARLSYLATLGVDALWLSPFYPSPMADSGYDVSDPRDVDPVFGTLDDARLLIDEAHARGIRIVIDIVPNHVSTAHRWFTEALASPPGSPARKRFHFRDGRGPGGDLPPTNWMSVFSGPAWTRVVEADGTPGQWYLHLFDSSQADLNWENPEVLEDSLETLRFWLDLGVDGFRVDVALGLAKDMSYADHPDPLGLVEGVRLDIYDGTRKAIARRDLVANSAVFDRDEVHEIYQRWREVLDSYPGDRMTIAEAWVHPPERMRAYVSGGGLHQVFNFDFLVAPWSAPRLRSIIEGSLDALRPALPTWALCNHDTARVATRLGGGREGLARARALALVAQALPGSVYVYQGEELGLEDVELPDHARQDPVWFRSGGAQKGRDAGRVPLPWSGAAPPYGFSLAPRRSQPTWLPQPDGWGKVTVAAQEPDAASVLAQYRTALRIRRSHPGLRGCEDMRFLDLRRGVLAFERGAGLVCLANCTERAVSVPLAGSLLVASGPGVETQPGRLTMREGRTALPPSTAAWLQT